MKNFIILLLTFYFWIGCKKENIDTNKELPDVWNTNAKDAFGCRINGEIWIPGSGGQFTFNPFSFYYVESRGELQLSAKNSNERKSQTIVMTLIFKDTGIFNNIQPVIFLDNSKEHEPWPCSEYFSDSLFSSFYRIEKLDKTSRTIIGTFGDLGINSCGDTIALTDGRFKLTYSI